MPRVATRTKSPRPTKRPYICTSCSKEIEPGQRYYTWARRHGGPRYRHTECGYPRATELSTRKTAAVEDAIRDASEALAGWDPSSDLPDDFKDDTFEISTDEVEEIIGAVADEAEQAGEEYTSGADNMPESLQYGSQAEAMREVGQELEEWASEIRYWSPTGTTTVDAVDPDEFDEREEWLDDLRDKIREAADEIRQDAESTLEALPEYQG